MRGVLRFFVVLCILNAAAISLLGQPKQPEIAGYVFGISGTWGIAPQYVPALVRGQQVRAGDVIRLQGRRRTSSYINIGLLDLSVLSIDCREDEKCAERTITAPSLHPPSSIRSRARALYSALFHNSTPPVVFTLARGGDSASPREAVLPLRADGPDLSAALKDLPQSEEYEVKLAPISGGPAQAALCRWQNSQAQLKEPVSLQLGVYSLQVNDKKSDLPGGAAVGSSVTVLVVDPKNYSQAESMFREASKVAAGWEKDVRPETVHYLLTVALVSISARNSERP